MNFLLTEYKNELNKLSNPEKAAILSRFFKTGKGEYGEGDVFLGITLPQQRKLAKEYSNISFDDIQSLLNDDIHEYRSSALIILILKYEQADDTMKNEIADFYLQHTKRVNNWDLVDLSAPKILGQHLLKKNRSILYKLARSLFLWERRISILSTFTFIKNNDFEDSLNISALLIYDDNELIHKAAGWMLREIGKRNIDIEEQFLKKHSKNMPRIMLRYAIEKFSKNKRRQYLISSR